MYAYAYKFLCVCDWICMYEIYYTFIHIHVLYAFAAGIYWFPNI